MNWHKYGAQKTNGFPSKLEASVYETLRILERANEIKNLKRYPTADLGSGIKWKIDFYFEYVKSGEKTWCEAKGVEDNTFLMKKKMWINGCGLGRLEIWKGSYKRPFLHEVIYPKGEK